MNWKKRTEKEETRIEDAVIAEVPCASAPNAWLTIRENGLPKENCPVLCILETKSGMKMCFGKFEWLDAYGSYAWRIPNRVVFDLKYYIILPQLPTEFRSESGVEVNA